MIDWELAFSTPYAQKLANGEIGSARVHARVLTNQYIKAIKLGAPPAIPPTLPSGIAPYFPPVPVGPGTYFNLYETRRMLFENTIYTYFQTKAILYGEANIKDAVQSLKRLQKKAKQIRDQIKTTATEAKIVTKQIADLPQEFAEFYNNLKSLIQSKIEEIKNILSFDENNKQYTEFIKQQRKELLQQLFGPELATYDSIVNFKPTLNPADYTNILNLYTNVNRELNKLLQITSSNNEFKKYLLKELSIAVKFILSLVEGLIDPNKILTILADYAAATTSSTLIKKTYNLLLRLLKKSRYLEGLQVRLEVYLIEKKKELYHYINNKIKKLKDWIKRELKELKKKVSDYYAKLEKTKYIKLIKEDVKKAKTKIQKARFRIQIAKDISNQVAEITKELNTLLTSIKAAWLHLLVEVNRIINFKDNTQIAIDSAVAIAADYKNNSKSKLDQAVNNIKNITPQDSLNFASNVLGKTSKVLDFLLSQANSEVSKEDLYTERISTLLKNKLNEINRNYKNLLSSLLTAIIKAQTLKKLIAYDATLKMYSGDIKTLQKSYTDKVNELKNQEAYQIKNDVEESARIAKPTFKDLVLVFDELTTLVDSELKMSQKEIEDEAKSYEHELKKAVESNKFLKQLQKKNAKILRLRDSAIKYEYELREKQLIADKQKIKIQKAKLAVTMGRAAGAIGTNLANSKYLISDNDQQLQKFIKSYYDYRLLDHTITKVAHDRDLKNTKDKLETFKKYELFVVLLVELFKDLQNNHFVSELKSIVEGIKANHNTQIQNNISDFLRKLVDILESGKIDQRAISSVISDTTLDIIISVLNVPQMVAVESKYTKRVLNLIKAYEDIEGKLSIAAKDEKLQQFFKDVRTSGSVLVPCLKYAKKYLIEPSVQFIVKIVNDQIDTIKKKNEAEIKKFKAYVKKQKQAFKDKLINVDAKIMSVMFGTAARLFWTGATWTNPAGTTFVVLNIGPFIPIKALPKDGADGMAREIGDGFNKQLTLMTGLVVPNPVTAIPPFPFNGYI